jgi:hypothetical protein
MHFKAMPTHKPRTPKQNSTATTTTTTKKAKGRALSLKRRHQRLGNHLKLTNKKLLYELCTYGKHHIIPSRDITEPTTTSCIADPTTSPTSELNTDQPTFRPTTRNMTRKSTSQKAMKTSKSTSTVNLTIVMPEHDTKVECED